MKNMRNPVISFIIFGILIGLCVMIYAGFEESYETEKQHTMSVEIDGVNETEDIMHQLDRLNIIEGMNDIGVSIQKIGLPSSGIIDILGGLAGVAIGVLKTITGVVTLPFSIGIIIAKYYQIPMIIYVGLGTIFFVGIGFILLSAYMRHEL